MFRASLVVVLASLAGCGGGVTRPETAAVSGSVKFKGTAVEGAVVSFVTEGSPRTAVGVTNAEGAFKLTTFDTDDGAIPGEHAVTITKVVKSAGATMESPEDYMKAMQAQKGKSNTAAPPGDSTGSDDVPAKYGNPADSGLKRTVVAGEENVFNFDLE